ncbi:MAG TPA: DUF4301 family protein [Bacteroidales bacterium]
MFTQKDIEQIEKRGSDLNTVEKQIQHFKSGFPFIRLAAAAIPEKGIHIYSEKEVNELAKYFDENKNDYDIIKFVPASGAASRMFKNLFEFREKYDKSPAAIEQYKAEKGFDSPFNFFNKIESFAFYNQLKGILSEKDLDIKKLIDSFEFKPILDVFLGEDGMNYAGLPKGLLHFHKYQEGHRLAIEEHLVEAINYASDKNSVCQVHLTVSPEHQEKFEGAVIEKQESFQKKHNVSFQVSFSQQKASSDTIAVDLKNEPFRNEDGSLLFRPAGHGALIENLNDLNGEIIFIKNIDNVVPDQIRDTTYLYKKAIGGLLFKLQEQCFDFLETLEDGNLEDDELEKIKQFAEKDLNIFIPNAYLGYEKMEKIDFLFNKMNRPMRICGMVKNEGEPGGGPFWVIDNNDEWSLQIVESTQIDFSNEKQKNIVQQSTHFNPVDLVCGVRDFRGNNFDLKEFVDPETGFISIKSKDGKSLKAQELPGLWNGAMADWITIFVEVPLITFNPVKTINDLLRPQHQS